MAWQTPPAARPNMRRVPARDANAGASQDASDDPRVGCLSPAATSGPEKWSPPARKGGEQNSAYAPPERLAGPESIACAIGLGTRSYFGKMIRSVSGVRVERPAEAGR